MGEVTALDRPAIVDISTTELLAKSFAQGCLDLNIPSVQVIFHGGEPMMIKPELFAEICDTLQRHILPVADLHFFIQTNGIVLNEKWLKNFSDFRVGIGVSIDGSREAHDRFRLSKTGKSTFDLTERNLKRLIDCAHAGKCAIPTTISVIDPANDYKDVYTYLRALGIQGMSFLLPDRNIDDAKAHTPEMIVAFGRALYEIFEAWFFEDNVHVQVTHIDRMLEYFKIYQTDKGKEFEYLITQFEKHKPKSQIIIARTDGTVAVNDTFIPALSWYKKTPAYSLKNNSLKDFLEDDIFSTINGIQSTLPNGCKLCKWRKICKGGDLENRYSEKDGFDNPSVYCEAYKYYFEKVCALLINHGYPPEMIPIVGNDYPMELML